MKKLLLALLATGLAGNAAASEPSVPPSVKVRFVTSAGNFVVELDGLRAPLTVQNFLAYVNAGYYAGTVFHRVIPGFVAQAGGYTVDLEDKPTRAPVPNEAGNGLRNVRGSIAMARTSHPHSATSQFYINLADNAALDPNPRRWGYCVFGEVVEGIDVLDAIAATPTGARGRFPSDVPKTPIVIEKVELVGGATAD